MVDARLANFTPELVGICVARGKDLVVPGHDAEHHVRLDTLTPYGYGKNYKPDGFCLRKWHGSLQPAQT